MRLAKSKIKLNKPVAEPHKNDVIDETALTDALKNERVRAAALDVTEIEPVDSNNPLLG